MTKRIHDVLVEKSWIAFDLDDTLHEFRRASSKATAKVLVTMRDQFALSLSDLEAAYAEVLRQSSSNAFSDGRTSHEYRKDRFLAVADHFSLSPEAEFITHLLRLYEETLNDALELKSGALELLSTLKRMGKKIAVITEGPQDAQERTIENLGLTRYVDSLATTNHFKVSKTEGLFTRVLQELGIPPFEMAYVGDSEDRDMKPGIAEGLYCIHFSEKKSCDLEAYPPCINKLNDLTHLLQVQNS
ncbi:Glyceraldehyde 3-phosphate phosphatase [Apiospora arundinis]